MDYSLAIAQQMLRYIMPDKNTLYVFCPFSIGDFLVAGGLCHAILKKKRKKSCVMILQDRFANSGSINFVGVKEIRYMPRILMDFLRQYVYATRDYENDNYIYGHPQMKKNFEDWSTGLIINPNLSMVNRYKENVFGLPLDTELLSPIIDAPTDDKKQKLHETYVLDKNRTIILTPYANSLENLEESFWIRLISELAKKNREYVFYTNVAAPHEKIIPGTAPIITNFPELAYLAGKINCFIGLRSGIFDFLAFTSARLLYINKGIGWQLNLDVNFNHANSRAFYMASAPEQAQIQTFMRQNNLTSIDDVTLQSHISGKDVALDMNFLIAKIVNAVN